MADYSWHSDVLGLLDRMKTKDLDGTLTIKSGGGVPGITAINAQFKPFAEAATATPAFFKETPKVTASPKADLDKRGQLALLGQVMANFGSGFMDKDNPMQAIASTTSQLGSNIMGNLAMKKILAQMMGEGPSNF